MRLLSNFNQTYLPTFKRNWLQFMLLGIALIILGIAAISVATFTTLISTMFLGLVIFLSGIIILSDTITFWKKNFWGFLLHCCLGLLYLCVGLTLLFKPEQGAISLTFLLGIFYIIAGVFRVGFYSAYQSPRWGWGWLNGIITLLLGIVIFTSWPVSGLFIIGLFVGIDLLFAGWTYLAAAFAAKYFARTTH